MPNDSDDQKKIIKELKAQMAQLKSEVKTLTTSNDSKNTGRKESIKQAKENVPVLKDQTSFPDFKYHLSNYLRLTPDIGKVLNKIKLPDTRDIISTEHLYKTNEEALKLAEDIEDDVLNDFNIWIISKIHKSNEKVHKRVNQDASAAKQLLELWYNILKKFNRNSDASREAHAQKWDNLKQSESDSWDDFRDAVVDEARLINGLWYGTDFGYSPTTPKVHDSDIWAKFKFGLNEKYKKILERTIDKMDDRKNATLDEKFAAIEAKLLDKGEFKKAESNTNYEQEVQEHDLYDALMARTNIPEKTTSNTDYSRVLMHKDDLKGLVCRHFSGTPNSCKYGSGCRFRHIIDAQERKTAIMRQSARFAQRSQSSQSSQPSAQRSQSSRSSQSSNNRNDEAIAQYAKLVNSKSKKAQKVAAMITSIIASDHDDSSSENEALNDGDYDDYLREHGVYYTEGTDQNEQAQQDYVMSSLAMVPSDSEEDVYTADLSDTSEIDIYDQDILKEQAKLKALYHARDHENKDSEMKMNKKEEKERKKLNILLDKARRKNEKYKRDYAKLKELKDNIMKEEERAKKAKEEKDKKEKEQKLRLMEEQERKRNELKRILEETNKYKQFMEEDLLGNSDQSDQSESDSDEPIKTKNSRAPGSFVKSVGRSVTWSIKWLFLILTGLALVSAVTKLPELLSVVTAPIVTPSTAFDVGHSFLKSDHRKLCHFTSRSVGLTVLDSGTTFHLTGDIEKFIGRLTKLDRPRKIQGFNSESSEDAVAWYKGTIEVQATVGGKPKKLLLKDALYVPCMKKLTLISQGQLDDEGHKFVTANGKGRCFHPDGSSYFDVKKRRGLYHVGKPTVSFLAMNKNQAHRKFGHLNEKDLDALGDWSGELSP